MDQIKEEAMLKEEKAMPEEGSVQVNTVTEKAEQKAVSKASREKKEAMVEIPDWNRKRSKAYTFFRTIIEFFYPRIKVGGAGKLPEEPVIAIMNHSHAHGPISTEIYYPRKQLIWATGEIMHAEEVQEYAMQNFFVMMPDWSKKFLNWAAGKIAPILASVMNSAHVLPVYLDARILSTFRMTVEAIHQGHDIVIFPENDDPHNQILNQFHPHFVDIAKRYYRQYKKEIPFVPVYLAPKLKMMLFGEPIYFNHENKIDQERERIVSYIQDEITRLAESLPEHVVIPFNVKPKKEYHKNTDRVV